MSRAINAIQWRGGMTYTLTRCPCMCSQFRQPEKPLQASSAESPGSLRPGSCPVFPHAHIRWRLRQGAQLHRDFLFQLRIMPTTPRAHCPSQVSALLATMSTKRAAVFIPGARGSRLLELAPDSVKRVSQSLQLSCSGWLIIVAVERLRRCATDRL